MRKYIRKPEVPPQVSAKQMDFTGTMEVDGHSIAFKSSDWLVWEDSTNIPTVMSNEKFLATYEDPLARIERTGGIMFNTDRPFKFFLAADRIF